MEVVECRIFDLHFHQVSRKRLIANPGSTINIKEQKPRLPHHASDADHRSGTEVCGAGYIRNKAKTRGVKQSSMSRDNFRSSGVVFRDQAGRIRPHQRMISVISRYTLRKCIAARYRLRQPLTYAIYQQYEALKKVEQLRFHVECLFSTSLLDSSGRRVWLKLVSVKEYVMNGL